MPFVWGQPFAPFSKSDKVGKACEWNYTRDRDRNRHHWQRNAGFGREGEPSPFVMEQVDDEGFHLVEQKTPAKPKWGPQRGGRGGMRGGMRFLFEFFVCRGHPLGRVHVRVVLDAYKIYLAHEQRDNIIAFHFSA